MMSLMLHAHYNFDTSFKLLAKHLKRFFTQNLSLKTPKNLGAFEKHAYDATSGGSIFPQISEVVRK